MVQKKFYPPIEALVELAEPSDAQISPDGARVAYVIRQTDWEHNTYTYHIWTAKVHEDIRRQGERWVESASSPRWSPDGRWLSFVPQARDRNSPALGIISTDDASQQHQVRLETGGYAFAWSPDNRSIAYLAPAPESPLRRQQREMDGNVIVAGEMAPGSQIWLLDLESQTTRQITQGDCHVTGVHWHPRGTFP